MPFLFGKAKFSGLSLHDVAAIVLALVLLMENNSVEVELFGFYSWSTNYKKSDVLSLLQFREHTSSDRHAVYAKAFLNLVK